MPEMSTIAIQINSLNHTFDSGTLFDNFSMSINKGSKTALLAPSGAGKSTLFQFIMGLRRPDSGEIQIFGNKLNRINLSDIRNKIAWLPQESIIPDEKTVDETITEISNFNSNKNKLSFKENVTELFDRLLLDRSLLKSTTEDLSGGERQRVGLVICLLLRKPVILLDEPTSALDEKSSTAVKELIFANKDLTMVAALHDKSWINSCDTVIELKK